MKKVGLYFGSFNPIHIGHLIVAEYFATQTDLEEVWLVVSPHNPLKKLDQLASDHHRLEMVKLALADNARLHANDIEFNLAKPSYTCDTLRILVQNFPNHQFTLIMGEDNMPTFHLWKEYEYILQNFPLRIFPRAVEDISNSPIQWSTFDAVKVSAPRIEVSSTHMRQLIASNKSTRYLLSEEVRTYLQEHSLYR